MGEAAPGFGTLLRRYRRAAGLTQEELAARAGVSTPTISALERGVAQAPHRDTTERLVQALALTPDEMARWHAAGQQRRARIATSGALGRPSRPPRPGPPHNLPVPLTSFIGREQEVGALRQGLDQTRLLTLTGPAGVGKTRLAVHVAAACRERYPHGVWLVELAPLTDPALVPQAVASALGLRRPAARPLLATLSEALRTRRLLLVLDNCEHLLDACAMLADTLLRSCPSLCVLATSREPLGLTGEVTWRVPPLALPAPDPQPALETLAQTDAVRLFVARAQAAQPRFALTEQNAATMVQVCQHLDGLPLALELAAARLRSLSLDHLAARLDQRFRVLTGGSRTALPRQQTLQATLDWSYSLLLPHEQLLFARLSVFVGGFTLEAAEAVGSGGAIAAEDVFDLLGHLVDKSLVSAEGETGGVERYRLLETLRQYGQERLVDQGDGAAVAERQARYYLALAEEAEVGTHGAAQAHWFDRLTAEQANLRTAATWLVETGAAEAALRLAAAQFLFWEVRGLRRQGLDLLAAVLEVPAAAPPSRARLKALAIASLLAQFDYDWPMATRRAEEALALAAALDDRWGRGFTLMAQGRQAAFQHDAARARRLLAEGVALLRQTDDRWATACALAYFGDALMTETAGESRPHLRCDSVAARAVYEESLAIRRALGDQQGAANALSGLAQVRYSQGDSAGARALLAESQALCHAVGDRPNVFWGWYVLGTWAREQGESGAAGRAYAAALASAQEMGDMVLSSLAVEGFAALCAAADPARALRLAGAAAALRGKHVWCPEVAGPLEGARQALSAAAGAAAWAEGQALTLDDAVALVDGAGAERQP